MAEIGIVYGLPKPLRRDMRLLDREIERHLRAAAAQRRVLLTPAALASLAEALKDVPDDDGELPVAT